MKIHELAKELNVESKEVLAYLVKEGADVKNHMSAVPEDMIKKVRQNFGATAPQEAPAKQEVKAVALPEHILKQVEGEAEAKAQAEAEHEKKPEEAKKPRPAEGDPAKKKKKIIAVFNPQHSSSQKGREMAQHQRDEKKKEEQRKKPLPSQVRPARDRVPDDEVKKPLPSQVRPARDRKPDDYVAPVEEEKKTETPVTEEVKEVIKPEEPKKEEPKAEPKKEEPKAEEPKKEEPKAEQPKKEQPAKQPKAEPVKVPEGKPGESEAVKSLRAKIVKGTVNPDDLLVTRPKKDGDRNNQNRKGGQQGGNRDNRQGQGRDNRQGQQGGNRDNRQGQQGGKGGQGGFRGRDDRFIKDKDDDKDNNQNRKGGQTSGGRKSTAAQGGGAGMDDRGKGKGGQRQQGKGKFEKQHGDKFDRLENERGAQRSSKQPVKAEPVEEEIKVITIPDTISVKDFAAKLKMQPAALIKKLFLQGKVVTVNDIFDFETAESIALDMDIICEHEVVVDYIEELLKEEPDAEETLVKRPPVVCVMGHVDHGKTSLLDAIRNTNVIAKEAGGITQHIGAYTVDINGESITFLDTPGHEAFTAMRLRGAQATDVAILVVAADDGVMPQTIEAINHARAAEIHVIVAINKIDKPGANIEKVKQELSDQGLVPEEWGGDTIFVPVSAKKGEGIETLLEMVLLDTEILELRANPDRMARGIVIEAKLDKGRGAVATLLVQKGTLKVGDHVAMGESYGKVRAMTNDKGQKIKEAGPSTPVEITGLNGVPNAGDTFVAFDNDKDAKQFAQVFIEENKKKLLAGTKAKMSLDDVFDQMKAGELKELNLIIKADVQGSVEAIRESMEKLSNDEVVIKCIHTGVGNVSVSDAILASASNAIIIAFNVGANADARDIIEHEKVDMRTYSVIYNAIDDVELAMKGMLEPIYEEVVTGHVEVRQTFKASGVGIIAGSYVTDGIVKRDSRIRLSRDGEQIYDGSVSTLKRFKDDAKEVRSGFECGIVLKDFQDVKEGDIMEAYEMKEVPRS